MVHFSDQPVPGAEKIRPPPSGSSDGLGRAQSGGPSEEAQDRAARCQRGVDYLPGHDETITGNQPVNVQLAVDPALNRETQAVTWYLNGSALTDQAPDATQFTLADLPRGTYTLSATVFDQPSGPNRRAPRPSRSTWMRTSVLSPTHKGTP